MEACQDISTAIGHIDANAEAGDEGLQEKEATAAESQGEIEATADEKAEH